MPAVHLGTRGRAGKLSDYMRLRKAKLKQQYGEFIL
jgi:hypothetical protein